MLVVTTPTGHIGSELVKRLVAEGEAVRVVARTPARLAPELRNKVEIVEGLSDDETVLSGALAGASALFHCVPPNFAVGDVDAYYLGFTHPAIAAMRRQGVNHVVTVSALGRGAKMPAGLVSAALRKDAAFEDAGLHVRALWCPGFMENVLTSLPSLRAQGAFFGPSRPDLKRPFVATKDIAAVAARLLRDREWSGPGGVAVLGPEHLSLDEMAAIMSDVLERPIRYQQVPADRYKAQLIAHGANPAFAESLVEMHEAKDHGLDETVPRSPENSTPTTFLSWCTEVLRPAFAAVTAPIAGA